jgi:hypothetical protein
VFGLHPFQQAASLTVSGHWAALAQAHSHRLPLCLDCILSNKQLH